MQHGLGGCQLDIATALFAATRRLRAAGSPSARLDAEVLLAHVLSCERLHLYRVPEQKLSAGQQAQYDALLQRRAAGEPVAYLTGRREFYGREFIVTPAVLIPRPETELLVELAAQRWRERFDHALYIADIGTGSGAIAVSLACLLPRVRVLATDVSPAALAVALENAVRHAVAQRVAFYQGDLLAALPAEWAGRLGLICANLPYVPETERGQLPPDVLHYEPHLALFGGPDGLALYRRLLAQAPRFLVPGGRLLLEIAPGQPEILARELPPGWRLCGVHLDLAGRERVVELEY
ncbi:peptide chain release factor N(5)-glutamine methyltransferase [Desulfurispora thermophila]|uniref:peptide chain release factor N(5)-glutamine methyltransferase n=1 Tax=Desulfurispora thermophila TaxID=265470 RepID=UPI000365BA5E|nr:peptide chain release factor N(5)-glutamine methyltransferase [Desulfurispora thermophila]